METAEEQASLSDDTNKEVTGEGQAKEQAFPQHLNTSQLREHLQLPIVVDQKLIHDILGVSVLLSVCYLKEMLALDH